MPFIRSLLSWLLTFFLSAVFVHMLVYPLDGAGQGHVMLQDAPGTNIFFGLLAQATGLENLEPTGRQIFGGLGVFAGFCLLVPPLRKFGAGVAILFFAIIAGLLISPLLPMELPQSIEGGDTDGGALLYLALASLMGAALLQWVHPRKKHR